MVSVWLSVSVLRVPARYAPTCVAAARASLLLSPVGARAVPLAARLRVLLVVPLVPPYVLYHSGRARALLCAALVSVADRQSKFYRRSRALTAESDRALGFLGSGHGLPGLLGSPRDVLRGGRSRPNTREIKSPSVDLGPLACVQGIPAHDYNTTNHLVLVAPTTCPSTTRWKLQAVPAQSFAWLDETCDSSARAPRHDSDCYFHMHK